MADPHHEPANHRARMHGAGLAHGRRKGLAIILLIKLLAVLAVLGLLWALRLELGLSVTALVLLHLLAAGVLVAIVARFGSIRTRDR